MCPQTDVTKHTTLLHIHLYAHRVIITMCACAQQGYAFGRVSLCMYTIHVCGQKMGCLGSYHWKSPVSVIYCLLVEFNGQKRGLLCQAIHSEKEIWNHSINGTKKGTGPGKSYYVRSQPHLVYMQCSYMYAMLTNAECQHTTAAVQTYNIATGAVCTDSAQSTQGTCSVELQFPDMLIFGYTLVH